MSTLTEGMTDEQREAYIVEQGDAVQAAMAVMDTELARVHLDNMMDAIRARSPEQIERMERAKVLRMEREGSVDYFSAQGAADRHAMLAQAGGGAA